MRKLLLLLSLIVATLPAMAQTFNEAERSYVSTPTAGLFSKKSTLVLNPDSMKSDGFFFPLPGCKVISEYGRAGYHSGIDIKTKANDTIYCAFNGVVRMSKSYGGYGKVIVVRHPSGLETVYSHNSKNFVKSGDKVRAGEPLALEGRTGRASTEHLHFETRVNGQHFNPNLLFDFKSHTLKGDSLTCSMKGGKLTVKGKSKK